jgi:hypothetical protein
MYRGLTAKTPGCVAFSLPVQRRNFQTQEIPAFFRSLHSQRSARLTRSGGFEPERRPVQVTICPRADMTEPIIAAARPDRPRPASALAPRRAFSDRPGGAFCRQCVQTGRRLMRQTVLPTMIHGRSTPTRSESSARRPAPLRSRSDRRPGLRFGLPLTPESGGPSRHPAARYALTVIRARRRQEFQNAQQNVDRCHPSGRNPGCRGPRQSRRRI